jgi:Holliday junction DNA helicase RuvB
MKDGDIELLKRIAEFEDNLDPESLTAKLGWRTVDAGQYPAVITRLRMEGLVEEVYDSNSYHGYRLSRKARAMLVTGEPVPATTGYEFTIEIPEDIFGDIVGHDDVKELLRACLLAEKPVHVLLAGPPALAKSLFLWDI